MFFFFFFFIFLTTEAQIRESTNRPGKYLGHSSRGEHVRGSRRVVFLASRSSEFYDYVLSSSRRNTTHEENAS